MLTWLSGKLFRLTKFFKWTGYMKIQLIRLDSTDHGIFGHLFWDEFDCVTLENDELEIPAGTYKVTLYPSPSYGLCPQIHVPGRTSILIHWGNWERNSKGCILVGENRNGFAIEHSKDTFHQMMAKWPNNCEVEIEIK